MRHVDSVQLVFPIKHGFNRDVRPQGGNDPRVKHPRRLKLVLMALELGHQIAHARLRPRERQYGMHRHPALTLWAHQTPDGIGFGPHRFGDHVVDLLSFALAHAPGQGHL